MSVLGIFTGVLANNIFQAIWLCCIVPEPKRSQKQIALIAAGTTVLYTGIATAICAVTFRTMSASIGVFLGYMIGVILYGVVYCFLISASHPGKSLFLFSGYFSVHTIIVTIVSLITNTYILGNWLVWGLRIVFNLAVLLVWLFFFRERLFRMYREIKSSYGVLSAISIMCYFVQALFWGYNMQEESRNPFFSVLLLYACSITIVVYLMIFRYMAQSEHTNRMKQLQANERFLQAQVESYKKIGENARQTRHDFRHHTMVVAEYARNKDYQAILSYLSEYNDKEREKYQETFCMNQAADTVLSAYASRCEQGGIEFNADIRLDNTEEVSDYDLVTILANVLENAVNGCMKTEKESRVEISVGLKGSKIVIVCKNTCMQDILFENDRPVNKMHDGIGVESIVNTAAKYNGAVDFSVSDKVFICRIILNNRKKK